MATQNLKNIVQFKNEEGKTYTSTIISDEMFKKIAVYSLKQKKNNSPHYIICSVMKGLEFKNSFDILIDTTSKIDIEKAEELESFLKNIYDDYEKDQKQLFDEMTSPKIISSLNDIPIVFHKISKELLIQLDQSVRKDREKKYPWLTITPHKNKEDYKKVYDLNLKELAGLADLYCKYAPFVIDKNYLNERVKFWSQFKKPYPYDMGGTDDFMILCNLAHCLLISETEEQKKTFKTMVDFLISCIEVKMRNVGVPFSMK